MEPLTQRQHEVLDFVSSFIADKGYAPTLQQIGAGLGLKALATVHKHLDTLQAKGHIRRRWNHPRTIELLKPHVYEVWATMSPADQFSDGRPHICLWGDKGSAVEHRDPDEKVCRVRVQILETI